MTDSSWRGKRLVEPLADRLAVDWRECYAGTLIASARPSRGWGLDPSNGNTRLLTRKQVIYTESFMNLLQVADVYL